MRSSLRAWSRST